nr:DUF4190 domain-containing protein [Streptomyces zinciresistens]
MPYPPPSSAVPFPAPGGPVPPPPLAPTGPGPASYGYPGGPVHPGMIQGGYPGPQGHPVPPPAPGPYGWAGVSPMPSNGTGTTSMALGIISAFVFCLWPVAILLGLVAVVLGAIGRAKAGRGEATNPGQALAGIICGVAGMVLGAGMAVAVFAVGT